MLNPRLTECTDCTTIQQLLLEIDKRMFYLSSSLYNNVVYILNKKIDADVMFDLLNYRRILTYKYYNSEYASGFTVENVISRVKRLTIGTKKDCMCEDSTTYTPTTTTTSTSSTTTTTTSSTTTTTTTTVAPTTTMTTTTI